MTISFIPSVMGRVVSMATTYSRSLGKTRLQFLHLLLDLFSYGQGVRTWGLINANNDRRFPVVASNLLINQDPNSIRETSLSLYRRAVGILTNDDVAKLFRIDQPAGSANGIGELLAFGSRFSADLAGGIHRALLLNGVCQDP